MSTVLALDDILDASISSGNKGLPANSAGIRPRDIPLAGWSLFDQRIVFPACAIKQSAVTHNRAVMKTFLQECGASLAPHGKTSMAPQLFEQQMQDGAWALTAATPAHVIVYRACGAQRIFYANELVDPAGIEFVLDELAKDPLFEFYCLVDSNRGAEILAEAVARRRASRPIQVLIEIGMSGKRCGVRTLSEALELVDTLQQFAPFLTLVGVEGFEGVVAIDEEGAAQVHELIANIIACATAISSKRADSKPPLISVGGSAFVQMVASEIKARGLQSQLLLRSGCYLTNDHGMYAHAQAENALRGTINFRTPLQPALEVWAHVLSRPEPEVAIVGLGKRDISHDIHAPRPILWTRRGDRTPLPFEAEVTGLNDQHAWLKVRAAHPLSVGDLVAFGCSHPCTTFDKWKYILVVDDSYDVTDLIATRF